MWATTENPYKYIQPAIRSRTQIFQVKPLTPTDISTAKSRALSDNKRGLGKYQVYLTPEARDTQSHTTNGVYWAALNGL